VVRPAKRILPKVERLRGLKTLIQPGNHSFSRQNRSFESPHAPFAKALGDARKIVVSNEQLEFTWRNSEQLEGELIEAVTALKNEPGDGTIGMSGSVSVVRQLLAAGLVDELHLLVHPIAVRKACGCSTRTRPRSR